MQRVCPVLHSDPCTEERVIEICDVAGRVDVGVRGLQRGIDEYSVVHREPSHLGQTHLGRRTHTDEHHISGQFLTRRRSHPADSIGVTSSRKRLDALPEQQVDPVLAVQFGEDLAKLKTQRPKQHGGLRLDDGHLVAIVARSGSRFQADPTASQQRQRRRFERTRRPGVFEVDGRW